MTSKPVEVQVPITEVPMLVENKSKQTALNVLSKYGSSGAHFLVKVFKMSRAIEYPFLVVATWNFSHSWWLSFLFLFLPLHQILVSFCGQRKLFFISHFHTVKTSENSNLSNVLLSESKTGVVYFCFTAWSNSTELDG